MPLEEQQLPARSDLVAIVYRALLDAITDGTLAPGERITQDQVAEKLRVSRSPVLQAFVLLKKDGLLEDAPGRGVQVVPIDPVWVAHLYEVRGALDMLATRRAAERKHSIDPALIEAGRRAVKRRDVRAIVDTDMAFHNAIYAASGNPIIAEMANRNWVHLRRVMAAVHHEPSRRAVIWDEHQAIADAIAKGDSKQAVLLSGRHIQHASADLVERLSKTLNLNPQEKSSHAATAKEQPAAVSEVELQGKV